MSGRWRQKNTASSDERKEGRKDGVFVCEERNESVREQTDVRLTGNSSESDGASGKELRDVALSCPGSQRSMPSHLSDL